MIQFNLDVFMISAWTGNYAILGIPVVSAFYIIADLSKESLTFQPGCGCESRLDKYPLILVDGRKLSNCDCIATKNKTTSSTNTTDNTFCNCPKDKFSTRTKETSILELKTQSPSPTITHSSANTANPSIAALILLLLTYI